MTKTTVLLTFPTADVEAVLSAVLFALSEQGVGGYDLDGAAAYLTEQVSA